MDRDLRRLHASDVLSGNPLMTGHSDENEVVLHQRPPLASFSSVRWQPVQVFTKGLWMRRFLSMRFPQVMHTP